MKWIKPKVGSERTVRKFAWFPTRLDDEPTPVVWFEYYYERQVYGYDTVWCSYQWRVYTKTQDDNKLEFRVDEDRRKNNNV